MKVNCIITSILITATWLELAQAGNMDFRYKPRGPPRPPRYPPHPPYLMKREQNRPLRNQAKPPRPIPLEHVPNFNFVEPQAPPVLLGPAIVKMPIPVRWQNAPQNQFNTKPETPLKFSPPITSTHEYDYQIQTNNVPTHSFPIKQVGEKGPIHTIPAPNLSPADRPAIIEEYKRPSYNFHQQQTPSPTSHQYQVTESNHNIQTAQKNVRDQQFYFSKPQGENYQLYNNGAESQQFASNSNQNNEQDLYQLINAHYNKKQPDQFNNYAVPLSSQTFVQHPLNLQPSDLSLADYKAMIAQSQPQKSSTQYLKELQHSLSNHNTLGNTAMFNYERHAANANQLFDNSENSESQSQSDPYIQEVLDLSDEIVSSHNKVESKSDTDDKLPEGSMYYTNLPNLQAADTLASLQTAGKINVQHFDDNSNNKGLNIYVPDSQHLTNFEVNSSTRHKKDETAFSHSDLDDDNGANDANSEANDASNQRTFGRRIKPKHTD